MPQDLHSFIDRIKAERPDEFVTVSGAGPGATARRRSSRRTSNDI